ncbi:MAG: class I SAM-dependent methyltransferase [Candidatus Heimdallarchaeota archaeon]|nr:class I SAM-dependent methyltransferase [Candidatus Heimdallarchaeota archaeon]
MKMLESSPSRYDRGIAILTLGKINKIYDRLIENIEENDHVLDIGCGTGMLSIRAVLKEATVVGIDINPQMLEIARKRAEEKECQSNLELLEMGVAELDKFENSSFDKILSGLCLSELSEDELNFTLKESKRILKTKGLFILGDENRPQSILKRMINFLLRTPLVIITYILTQTSTSALKDIELKLQLSGYEMISVRKNFLGNFIEIVAKNAKEDEL